MRREKSQQINLQTHRDNMLIYMLLNDVAFSFDQTRFTELFKFFLEYTLYSELRSLNRSRCVYFFLSRYDMKWNF
jgi:hypothetical protein